MTELKKGDSIPELRVTPDAGLTKRYAEASGDPNPIHTDPEFAKSAGLPGCILHGLWTMAQVARASEALVSTDIPRSEVDTFMQLALKARQQPIRTVSFVPPAVNTSHPDIAMVQTMVKKAIDSSEGATPRTKKRHRAHAPTHAPTHATTVGGSIGDMHDGYAANQAANLSSAC